MAATWGDVQQWRSAPLGSAGDSLKTEITTLEDTRDVLDGAAIPDSFTGLARWAAEGRRRILVLRADRQLEDYRSVRRALYDAEGDVVDLERMVREIEDTARTQELSVSSDGTVSDVASPPRLDDEDAADDYERVRQGKVDALAERITQALAKAAHAEATISEGIPEGAVDDIDNYGSGDADVAERWATMTDDERRAVVEQMTRELADEWGVDMPEIRYEPESWGPWGSWSNDDGVMRINEGILDDPDILFNTIAHEMRHGRQYEAIDDEGAWHFPWSDDPFDEHEADGISEEDVEVWDENFDDYKTTDKGDSYEDYFNQPVEVDAREAGRDHLEGMTLEELERLLEESR